MQLTQLLQEMTEGAWITARGVRIVDTCRRCQKWLVLTLHSAGRTQALFAKAAVNPLRLF